MKRWYFLDLGDFYSKMFFWYKTNASTSSTKVPDQKMIADGIVHMHLWSYRGSCKVHSWDISFLGRAMSAMNVPLCPPWNRSAFSEPTLAEVPDFASFRGTCRVLFNVQVR